MIDPEIFLVGSCLSSVRTMLSSLDGESSRHSRLQRTLSTVAVERSGKSAVLQPAERIEANSYFIGRLLFGLVQRGISPWPTIEAERALLGTSEGLIRWSEKPERGKSDWFSADSGDSQVLDEILAAHLRTSAQSTPNFEALFDSTAERAFYENHLSRLLGTSLRLVEPQRPLQTMVGDGNIDAPRLLGQRVDFALETATGTKIAFEVDGSQHQEPKAKQRDAARDSYLEKAGWHVERVPTAALQRIDPFSEACKEIIKKDKVLGDAGFDRVESQSSEHIAAVADRLVLWPHAWARVQLAIALALMDGALDLDASVWSISLLERDSAIGPLAVADALRQITHLCSIYSLTRPPHCELAYATDCDQDPLGVTKVAKREIQSEFVVTQVARNDLFRSTEITDLFVDLSVQARFRDHFPGSTAEFAIGQNAARHIVLRTAYRRAPERFLEWPEPRPVFDCEVNAASFEFFLREIFRLDGFRKGQLEIISRAMRRRSAVGLLPTGSGKSVTFQLPALLSPGMTVVVAPLRSLMDDQYRNLRKQGITRADRIHGGQKESTKKLSLSQMGDGALRLLYVSPERFQSESFRSEFSTSPVSRSVPFVTIDEAHCVSEWGHEFRPAYLNLGRVARQICRSGSSEPPLLALTATASQLVLTDIQRELNIPSTDTDAVYAATDFDRPNLVYQPIVDSTFNKRTELMKVISTVGTMLGHSGNALFSDVMCGGLVFCRHVNGEYGVAEVAAGLRKEFSIPEGNVQVFAGKPYRGYSGDWDLHREKVQSEFSDNKYPLLVATHGFGMGIDKPNIRYTIHYGIPGSLEALAQESGRAGRDGKQSICAVVFTDEQPGPLGDPLDTSISAEQSNLRSTAVPRHLQGDLSRLLYFHGGSFKGVENDFKATLNLLERLKAAWQKSPRSNVDVRRPAIGTDEGETSTLEMAIYRLSLIGVVEDYTTDWFTRFSLHTRQIPEDECEERLREYVGRYRAAERADAVIQVARDRYDPSCPYEHLIYALCDFIYEEIEKGRRTSMRHIIDALRESGTDGNALKQKINEHLSSNPFSGRLFKIAQELDPESWWSIATEVISPHTAEQMLSQCRRALENVPDHPGLLLLEAVGMTWSPVPDITTAANRAAEGLRSYERSYGASRKDVHRAGQEFCRVLRASRRSAFEPMIREMILTHRFQNIAVSAYPFVSSKSMKQLCSVPWLRRIDAIAREALVDHIGEMD